MARTKSSLSALFQHSIVMLMLRRMPLIVAGWIFHCIGTLYHLVFEHERKHILRNILDFARPLRRKDVDRIFFGAKQGLYEHYLEKMIVATRPRYRIKRFIRERSRFLNHEILKDAYEQGDGVILVTAHWGAVELIPALLYLHEYPVSIVLETSTPKLAKTLARLISGSNVELIIESAGSQVLKSSLEALKRGRILMTQLDEVDVWKRRKGSTISLFNRSLYFDHMLDFVSSRTGAPAVGIFGRRLPGRRYEFQAEEINPEGNRSKIARKSLELWERYLIDHPDQWYQWKKWHAMIPEDTRPSLIRPIQAAEAAQESEPAREAVSVS